MPKFKLRDTLYLPAAKIYFILTGYLIYFALTRILTEEHFGIYGVVMGLVSVVNMMFVNGALQATSKLVSERGSASAVLRAARGIELVFGGGVFLLFLIFAPAIAGFFHDSALVLPLRIAGAITFFYAFYSANIGALNGLGHFRAQGCFDMVYATMKTVLVLILAGAALSAAGAIAGVAAAAGLICVMSFVYLARRKDEARVDAPLWRRIFYYQMTVMAFAFAINLIMNTDLLMVKKFMPPEAASAGAGFYTACLTIARIPYMLLVALNFILFPLVSGATHANDMTAARRYAKQGIRIAFAIAFPAGLLMAAESKEVIQFIYPDRFAQAARALSVIGPGYAFFALFVTASTMITGSARPLFSVLMASVVWIFQTVLCAAWIPRYGFEGAATASLAAFVLGAILSLAILMRRYRMNLPWGSLLRIAAASGILYVIGVMIPANGLWLPVECLFLTAVYGACIYFSGEITTDEKGLLRKHLSVLLKRSG